MKLGKRVQVILTRLNVLLINIIKICVVAAVYIQLGSIKSLDFLMSVSLIILRLVCFVLYCCDGVWDRRVLFLSLFGGDECTLVQRDNELWYVGSHAD